MTYTDAFEQFRRPRAEEFLDCCHNLRGDVAHDTRG